MSPRKFFLFLAFLFPVGSANALLLNGTNVPKDHIIVYLLIGHSNMAGNTTVGSDGVTAPRIWNYQWFSNKQWVAAKETPGNMANGLSAKGEGGPGMSFLKDMAAAYPLYNFGVVSNASLSATCRGVNQGSNSSGTPADSNRYWKGAHLYNEILAAAKEVQASVTFGGMICMLGTVEATRTSDSVCRNFGNDITQMVKDFRADLGEPNLPFIIGEYENGATGTFSLTMPWPKLVDAGIKSVPSMLSLSATINSVGIAMADDHHYTTTDPGRPEFSRRVVAMIKSKNWFPPPSIASAIDNRRGAAAVTPSRKAVNRLVFLPAQGLEVIQVRGATVRIFRVDGRRPAVAPARATGKLPVSTGE
jgi:Carbohydrate esterase, sialic acid-specific acetylesterase